jgi:hypothetical protein
MRFSSFFTSSSTRLSFSTGAATVLLGFSLCGTLVRAQDRNTEAGEAQITGMYPPFTYRGGGYVHF